MANNRKIPGKPKKPAPPPKNSDLDVLQQKADTGGEDINSDAGSFLDDDTEDFLPGNWTGNTTKSKTNIPKKRPTPSSIRSLAPLHVEAAKTTSKDVDCTTSTTKAGTIIFNPLQPYFQPGMIYTVDKGTELDSDHHTGGTTRVSSIEDQLVIETSQLTLDAAISSETFDSIEDQLCSNTLESPLQSLSRKQIPTLEEPAPEDTPMETNSNTVTISRLQVPAPLIRLSKPQSELEKLQDENATLRRDVAKKERDLKSSKAQVTQATSAAKKQEEDALRLRNELTEQCNIRDGKQEKEIRRLQLALKGTQSERQKAKMNLRLERTVMGRLRQETKDLGRTLRVECAKSSILQLHVDQLKKESNNAAEQRFRILEIKLAAEKAERRRLPHQCSESDSQLSGLGIQLSASRATIATRSDDIYRDLKQRYDTLVLESQAADRRLLTAANDLRICRQERDSTREQILAARKAWADAVVDVSTRDQSIAHLQSKVSLLESDRNLKAQFIKRAVDVRLTFLEQARETIHKLPRGDVDLGIIENGNNVAHRAYGALDAAMFNLNLIPEEYKATGEIIFENLYTVKPSQYGRWYPKAERLIDCRASVSALKSVSRSSVTEDLREEHLRIDTEICGHQTMPEKDFESSIVVEELIAKLESLTDEIIQLDRFRHGGRGRRSPRADDAPFDISDWDWNTTAPMTSILGVTNEEDWPAL